MTMPSSWRWHTANSAKSRLTSCFSPFTQDPGDRYQVCLAGFVQQGLGCGVASHCCLNTGASTVSGKRYIRLAKEGSWIIIGQIASVLGSLVLVRVLTEHLDPTQYGQLALGLTVATLVNQVVMGGVTAGIGRFYSIAAEKQDLHGYLRDSSRLMGYATLAVLAIGLVLMAGLLWLGYSHWMGLATAALVFSVLSGFNGTLSGIQNAARQRAIAALHGGFDAWLKIFLALGAMFWLGASSTAVVLGYASASALLTMSQLFFLRPTILRQQTGRTRHPQFLRDMWAYSWPFSIWGVFSWAQQASSRWAIELFGSTNDVGLFQVLSQVGFVPIQIFTSLTLQFISPILFSRSGDATSSERNKNVKTLSKNLAGFGIFVTLLSSLIGWIFHREIFRLLVAEEYHNVSYLMPWVILAGGLLGIAQIFVTQMFSELRTKEVISAGVVTGLIGTACNVILVYLFNIYGAVAALCVFATINVFWLWRISIKQKVSEK
jgi:O-antigen/teichoic acid export membrane protein